MKPVTAAWVGIEQGPSAQILAVASARAAQRGGKRRDLHGHALGLEADAVGEQYAAPGDLRNRQIDEHDAAREHLHAERHVRQRDEESRDERRQQDGEIDRAGAHCEPFRSRAIVSSKSPYRSVARSSPPTVNGSTTGTLDNQTLQALLGLTQTDPSNGGTSQTQAQGTQTPPHHHHRHHGGGMSPPTGSPGNASTPNGASAGGQPDNSDASENLTAGAG